MRADGASNLAELEEANRAKEERLAETRAVAGRRPPPAGLDNEQLWAFLDHYYAQTPAEEILERSPDELYSAAVAHYDIGHTRPVGSAAVRAFALAEENAGGVLGTRTVVQIVTDDMPFLVDSVTGELNRQERGLHLVVHPVLVVQRDITGVLRAVPDVTDPATAPAGTGVESWMHIEIDREPDPEQLRAIETDLRRVLSDVRDSVEDWQKMAETASHLADELVDTPPKGMDPDEVTEAAALLRWLREANFTFLGYREYLIDRVDGEDVLRVVPSSGLGILRADADQSSGFRRLPPTVRQKAREKKLLVLTQADSRSTVHRQAYLDYIGVKRFDANGDVIGERRFLGLFTSRANASDVLSVPVVRRTVTEVIARSGFLPHSHSGKDLLDICETYPRPELFQVSPEELLPVVLSVLHLRERRQTRLFLRRDAYGRFFTALVYLPRDRYTTEVRLRMTDILREELNGDSVEYSVYSTESVLTRLYFVLRPAAAADHPAPEAPTAEEQRRVESRLIQAARSWVDDLADVLAERYGAVRGARLANRYGKSFSEGYKADFPPASAVDDLDEIERIQSRLDSGADTSGLGMRLYRPDNADPGTIRFKIYKLGEPVPLSAVLPVLQHMGVDVVDERPYQVLCPNRPQTWIYDFGLTTTAKVAEKYSRGDGPEEAQRFATAFARVWAGEAEDDGLNALVLLAGLDWRQVTVLRTYVRYLRQGGLTLSQAYVERALANHPAIVRLIVELFETRFDPEPAAAAGAPEAARAARCAELTEQIRAALVDVSSLDEDRILSALCTVVEATQRTNYFQPGADGRPRSYLAVKLDSGAVPDLPAPRPYREIWVYSPRFEGVHLRFGPVARGGLRWSDRGEDLRTEILGLVKAQMVKNTVIVPTGAKGGFVAKRLPDPSDREAWLAEGISCYRTFVSGLLDLTDNRDGSRIVPPDRVVRYDSDDSYLVVAADKGTATFSDIANELSAAYDYWLGDAFASGGSVGYDHKAMGITARGAWVSVRRHFRELGLDTQTEAFTVVGVGDMSGDVFGNGMLLSPRIRLVAAFDHRHVFCDPDPDPDASFAERRRLFELPRSSWADYDASLISAGGGVWPRTAKSVPISPQLRVVLGLSDSVTQLTPNELIRAILLAPVDLLWNGGIGTYVKAGTESNSDVGDKANDAVRVNGADLRCRVVGEGGNLGLTQLGRGEYALSGAGGIGGKVNTDAIDNSAGVDTSDHEVNIKVVVDRAIRDGELAPADRAELLHQMSDEVAALVLRDNYDQNVALASEVTNSLSLVDAHMRVMRSLVRSGRLDRSLEFLPTDRQLAERARNGRGLTQPEFAVLLAYVKIAMSDEVRASDLPDDPAFRPLLYDYFPAPLPGRFRSQMDAHPLHREIVATQIVNAVVNTAGITGVFRLEEETGASTDVVIRAQTAARYVFDLPGVWSHTEALDGTVPAELLTAIRTEVGRLVERGMRWFVHNGRQPLDITATVSRFRSGASTVLELLPGVLRGLDAELFQQRQGELVAGGVPADLATKVAALPKEIAALDLVAVADESGQPLAEVTETYFMLADELALSPLLEQIIAMPRADRWQTMARASLRDDLNDAHARLTAQVLACGAADATPEARLAAWREQAGPVQTRAMSLLSDISSAESADLATIVVANRVARELLRVTERA